MNTSGNITSEQLISGLSAEIEKWKKADLLEEDDIWEAAEHNMCKLIIGNIASGVIQVGSPELPEICTKAADDIDSGDWTEILEQISAGKFDVPDYVKTMANMVLPLWYPDDLKDIPDGTDR